MPATAAVTALYLLLAPVPGQAATTTPSMEQLAVPLSQDDCNAAAAHSALAGVGCFTQDSAEAGRVTADITPTPHHAAAPMVLGK